MANLRTNKIVSTTGSNAITGSVEFDGTDDRLTFSSSSDFAFGTGDFNIDFWFNSGDASSTSQRGFIQTSDTSGGLKTTYTSGFAIINGFNKSGTGLTGGLAANIIGTWIGSAAGSLPIVSENSWNHCALTRSSGVVRLFLNGILIDSATISGSIDGTNLVVGGYYSTSYLHKGFISNLRIVKGTALYTQNFIPPTTELRNVPGTVLLCCQNPSSATQEATGKTITVNGNATARNFAPAVGSDGTVTFDGVTKISTPNYFYLPTGNTEDRGGARGVFGGGAGLTNTIDYITISTTNNAIDFGDLTVARFTSSACASNTRGIFGGGYTNTPTIIQYNVIDYITISITGNAIDFGDLTRTSGYLASSSSSTRGLFGGGQTPTFTNIIDYITIASTGNAQDFGDLSNPRDSLASCSNSTRSIFAGGYNTPARLNIIDFVTIASTGNAQDFGDLLSARNALAGSSNSIRGLFGGGLAPTATNTIEYITISSTGNATDFGDLLESRRFSASCSSNTRSVFAGGNPVTNTIDYVTIMNTGNATDFGDLTVARNAPIATSNAHGGLG